MKKITKSKHCRQCLGCCKFIMKKLYFAPIFTEKEIYNLNIKQPELLKLKYVNFKNFNKSNNIKQIKLIKNKNYYCPFYIHENGKCKIYKNRPFDCQIYPFLLVNNKKNNSLDLYCFNKNECASINNINDKEFKNYSVYLLKLLKSKYYNSLFKKYPDLAWPKQSNAFFIGEIMKVS